MNKLIIHHLAWGELYRRMLLDYCIPSLVPSYDLLRKMGVPVQWVAHLDSLERQPQPAGVEIEYRQMRGDVFRFTEVKEMVAEAAAQKCYIALIAPDSLHAQETLYNAYRIANDKDVGVAVANSRVRHDWFMDRFPPGKTYGHRELVRIAMDEEIMHDATRNSFDDQDVNCCNWGVSIRRLPRNRYAVIHTLASPMILHPSEQDARDFQWEMDGGIDRLLNGRLFGQNRIKLAASSDLCFFVELTRPERNMPPLSGNLLNCDRNCNAHENIWNNTCILWDGSPDAGEA